MRRHGMFENLKLAPNFPALYPSYISWCNVKEVKHATLYPYYYHHIVPCSCSPHVMYSMVKSSKPYPVFSYLPCSRMPPVTGGCPAVEARKVSVVGLAWPEILVGDMELREGDHLGSEGEGGARAWGEGQDRRDERR